MKRMTFALALLLGGVALAQNESVATTANDGDGMTTLAFETETGTATARYTPAASGELIQAGNSAPERDARGFAVISDPAVAPPGWNGTPAGSAMGGPELDPATGQPFAAEHYPPCTRTVTDNCLQTYERGRSAS
jgi:hypothetical protein